MIKLDFSVHVDKTAYITLSPCYVCSVALINAGIKRVLYLYQYRDTSGIDLLADAGIAIERYEKKDTNEEGKKT